MQNCGVCVTVLTNVCLLYLSHLFSCACRKGPWDVFPPWLLLVISRQPLSGGHGSPGTFLPDFSCFPRLSDINTKGMSVGQKYDTSSQINMSTVCRPFWRSSGISAFRGRGIPWLWPSSIMFANQQGEKSLPSTVTLTPFFLGIEGAREDNSGSSN